MLDVVRDYRWGRVEETIGEDPYLVAIAGHRLRAGPPVGRRDRDPEALRRLLRVACRTQPRAGVDGPARAARRHPALVRDGRRARRRRLGDELLLRRRRRPGRRQPLAAHRGAARGVGLRGHGGLRLLGGPVPGLHAPGRRRTTPRPVRWPSRQASTSSCPTRSGTATGWSSWSARAPSTRRSSTGPPAGRSSPRHSSACSTPGGRPRRRSRTPPRSTSTRRPTGSWPARSPSARSSCSTPAPRCRSGASSARCRRRWPWSGPAPTTR